MPFHGMTLAVRISPAPLQGRVLSAEDGYRFVPETRA
jgi:hypothetical protein